MGYHLRPIKVQGVYGEVSKVYEELDEFEEALEQKNPILAVIELADAYGALEALAKNHGYTMEELAKMSDATSRAFEDGTRKAKV